MSRPNILVIQADQLTAKVLPMYGGPTLITPHMNRLAEQGVTFLNAYSNNPVCAPSRAAMLTGRLSSEVGCYDNAADMPSSTLTLAHYLRRQGYRTCLSGKMHFVGAEQLHGFEERVTTDIYPSDFGWTADWTQVKQPYSPSRMSLRSIVEAGLCERNLQIDYDEEVAYRAEQWLFDQARSDDERPFLLWASFTHPHNPFITTKKFWDLYDHDKIDMPTVPFIPIADRDPWSKRYAYTIRADEHDVSEEQIRVARHAYYAMTSYFDAQVGRLLEVVDRTGSADNTFAVLLILVVCVSLIDLLPTFNDLVSEGNPVAPVDRLSGTSLAGMLHGTDASRGDDVMMEFLGEGVYAPACILRKDGYKYVYCRHDPAMLFDLKADPDERTNLTGQAGHADVESRMHSEVLKRWDYSGLEKTILDSQQRRLFAQESLLQGSWTSWDYQPPADAARKYVRGAVDPNTTATKAKKRFPFVVAYPPDHPRDPAASLQLEPNADSGKMSRS